MISKENFPEDLIITSVDENGQIMSTKHKIYDVRGVQYHPESVLTPNGKKILENWLNPIKYQVISEQNKSIKT